MKCRKRLVGPLSQPPYFEVHRAQLINYKISGGLECFLRCKCKWLIGATLVDVIEKATGGSEESALLVVGEAAECEWGRTDGVK